MDGEAVSRIAELAKQAGAELIDVDGVPHSAVKLHDATPSQHPPVPIELNTLTGLVGYLDANRDRISAEEAVVHVGGPTRVDVVSGVKGDRHERFTYAVARADGVTFGKPTEAWYSTEDFLIKLNTLCADAGDREKVTDLAGNILSEAKIRQEDDGFTQKIEKRGGVTLVGEVAVENPVALAPYRTFREIEQPVSPFILRFRGGDDSPIKVGLFEADAGTWELTAIERIVDWLGSQVPAGWVVIG